MLSTQRDIFSAAWTLALRSNDPSTQNAALIADSRGQVLESADNQLIAGYNHIPLTTRDQVAAMTREEKYAEIIHAEQAAIIYAARTGVFTQNATLYALWVACPHCASTIIAAGINKVVGLGQLHRATPARWKSAVELGLTKLRNASIEVDWYEGPIDSMFPILFSGEDFYYANA